MWALGIFCWNQILKIIEGFFFCRGHKLYNHLSFLSLEKYEIVKVKMNIF
jgi:hypothetical protein